MKYLALPFALLIVAQCFFFNWLMTVVFKRPDCTLSRVIDEWTAEWGVWPVVVGFAFGVMASHWFESMPLRRQIEELLEQLNKP